MSDGLKDALTSSGKLTLCGCVSAGHINVTCDRHKIRTHDTSLDTPALEDSLKGIDIPLPLKPNPAMYFDSTQGIVYQTAVKHDTNKIPVELLPSQALEEIAKVLAFGAIKYDSWNWAKGFKWMRLIGAAIRHLYAFQRGEDKDPESGLSHLAHAGCCVLFLLQHEISKLGQDDRYKEFTKGDK